jgi:hypothetical protein
MRSRWYNLLVLLSLVLGLVPVTAVQAAPAAAPTAQGTPDIEVESVLRNQLAADATTGYLIYFDEKPDLSPAYQMDWIQRGRFVANALQRTAERSQARVRAYLDAQGAEYKAFWVDNVIVVESSNLRTFNALSTFAEVSALRARRQPMLYEPVEITTPADSPKTINAPAAIEPNLLRINADGVWSMGYYGEGIVVANIDTGVRYTHQALVNQYRGNLGGGNFDHNYNWWDPYQGTTAPNDFHSHGSHTMGTMVGDDGGANQIGMAPGAQWMACKSFQGGNVDAQLLECGQFMAAPWDLTGANANPDLRPNIVNNSWGDCGRSYDTWYEGVLNTWHAAGIYPSFSNGNASNCGYSSPPGLNTVGNPARSGNVTGVGSTGRSNGQYATYSNWGPTDNPDTLNPAGYPNLKPQVAAPGLNRSVYKDSDTAYGDMSGTSMASPHVAGLIALMWSAGPCLVGDYVSTETILQQTAVPIPYATNNGDEGPGNVPNHATGWGEINAYAAVQAAEGFCGDSAITGEVLDAATNASIAGAMILITNEAGTTQRKTTSDAQGVYTLNVFSDTYTLQASYYGYQTTVIPDVVATTGMTTTQHVALTPAAFYEVSGQVTDATTGWPLYAQINVTGDPIGPPYPDNTVWTDPETGMYSIMLAEGVTYTFGVDAWVAGYDPAMGEVGPLTTDTTADFALQANMGTCTAPGYYFVDGMMANFEDATFPPAGWTVVNNGGACAWVGNDPGERGNLTGATGKFAIADSDECGLGTTMNTDLISPPFDVSGLSSVILKFAYDYRHLGSGSASVAVSADDGQTWVDVVTWTANQRGPATFNQDITALVGGSTAARVRFRYLSPGWYWWWQVDDVVLGNPVCQAPTDGGLVVGNVYDENYPTVALNGAEIVNAAGYTAEAVPTPLDDAVDDGFYTIFAPAGTQTFTATTTGGYGADVVDVTVLDGNTVAQDFLLPAGLLSVSPEGLNVTVELGYTDSRTLTLENAGDVAAEFTLSERAGQTYPISIPAFTGALPQKDLTTLSTGPAPRTVREDSAPAAPNAFPLAGAPPAFAVDIFPGTNLVYIPDATVPGTWDVVGGLAFAGAFAGDFLGGDFSQLYVLDSTNKLYSVDTATGAATEIGNSAPASGQSWTGMTGSVDGTLYASSTNCGGTSMLYTVDPATGAVTPIGQVTNAGCLIDIAINADGEMYGVDIVSDMLVQIDPNTGAGTEVGSTGFNANYAQGMDFEDESGILYWAAYGTSGEMRVIDTTTGASAHIGAFPGGAEVDCLAFPTGGGADVPWLDETPVSGAVPAEGSTAVTVDFDAAYVDQPGEYHAELILKNDTPYGKFNIPVTMTVTGPASWGKVSGTVTGLGVCDGDPAPLAEAEVFVESATTAQTWMVTTDISGTYHLWMDQAHSPVKVTVTAPDYFGEASGVVVVQGETTVVDFDLRLLLPCLSYDPAGLEATLEMGANEMQILDLHNTGAAMATFELTELGGDFWPAAPMQIPLTTVTIGDPIGDNAFTVNPAPASPSAPQSWPQPEAPDGAYILTHSLSQEIIQNNSVSCNASGLHTDNSYMRAFYLPDFGIMNPFEITEVEMGIETAAGSGGNQPVEVRLYTLNGALLWANLTLIGQASVNIPDQNLSHFTIPVTGDAPAGSTLVVEFFTPSGQDAGHSLFVGSNNLGQTALSYLAAADCGIAEPTDTGTIGFPGMHIVMNVTGVTAGVGGVPWLFEDPISGTIPADSMLPVDITFDAGVPETMQPGEYHAELQVTSDAPNAVPGIPVTLTVLAPSTWGKIAGTVTGLGYCDAMTPTLLEDAEVTIESGAGPVAWMLTTDENGEYAFWLDAAHSPVTITVAYPDHVAEVISGVMVTADDTEVVDAALRWAMPCLTVDPDMFDVTVTLGMSTTLPFSLTNSGAGAAIFDLAENNSGMTPLRPLSIPAFEGELPASSEPASTGRAPQAPQVTGEQPLFPLGILANEPAYAIDVYPGENMVYIPDTMSPGAWNIVGGVAGTFFAGDFVGGDFSKLYAIDNGTNALHSVDTATGAATLIGPSTPSTGESWTGATGTSDGMLYVSSTNCGGSSTLYTVNLATGAVSAIGNTGIGCLIDIAINANDEMYGVDIVTDQLYQINPATGAASVVGALGVDANYAQGMDFEEVSGVLYWAAYTTQGALRIIDTTTGASALVGVFPGGAEVDCLAFPTGGGGTGGEIPWLFEDPESGTVPADDTFVVDLTFDASEAVTQVTGPGEYFGTLFVNSNDPVNDEIAIPVTMTVEPPATWGKLMGTVQSLGYCDADSAPVAGAEVLVEHSDGMTWTLTTDVSGTYQIWLESGTLTVTVEAPDHAKGEAVVTLTAGETITEDFDLRWLVPCVETNPLALHATLELGATTTEVLTLNNTGAVDTDWDLVEENLGADLTGPPPSVVQVTLLEEGFEDVTFPPAGWANYDVDGVGTQWVRTTASVNSGTASAFHNYSSAADQTGWLVTPPLAIVPGTQLSFYDRGAFMTWYEYSGAWLSTGSCDPADGDFVELWEVPNTANYAWRQVQLDLSAYAGETVCLAFRYAGNDAHTWYLDDVRVYQDLTDYVTWLAENPTSGILSADTGEQVVDVTFDASVTGIDQPGDYVANLWINSDDPTAPLILPVTMTVTPPAAWGLLDGVVFSLGRCEAELNPVEGAEVTIENGISALVTTDVNGEYSYWLAPGTYTVTASAADHLFVQTVITIETGIDKTVDFSLAWLGPCVSVEPNLIVDTLPMGASSTHIVTITNEGLGAVNFEFFEYAEGYVTLPMAIPSAPVELLQLTAQEGYGFSVNPDAHSLKSISQPAPLGPMPTGVYVLTHSLSQAVLAANSVSCNAGGLHADNSYLRVFDLNAFGIPKDFEVLNVAVGIETAAASTGGVQSGTVNVYTLSGPLAWANMTLVGTASVNIVNQTLTVLDIPVSAMVPAGSVMVVEFFTPEGQTDGHSLYVGSNNLGQTAPTYLAAGACGVAEPVDVAAIGFPGMHMVMNVTGFYAESLDLPWVSEDPMGGVIGATSVQTVVVTLDADQVPQPGVYYATLEVESSDPGLPTFPISVIMTATLPATYGQITGTVMGLGPCDDPLTAMPLAGAEVTVESATQTWMLSTDADGAYALWLDEAHSPLTITVAASDYISNFVTGVAVLSGTTTVRDFTLRPEAPCLAGVMPAGAHVTLAMGMSTTMPITVVNTGAGALDWTLKEADGGFQIMAPAAGEDILVVSEDDTSATVVEATLTNLGYTYLRVTSSAFTGMSIPDLLTYKAVIYVGPPSSGSVITSQ